jgi:hypothetical protein
VTEKGVNGVKEGCVMCGREVDAWWDAGGCRMGKAWGKGERNKNLAVILPAELIDRGNNQFIV